MADLSNYGTLLKVSSNSGSSYNTVAGLVKLTPPPMKNPAVNSTNHGSGLYTQVISANQVDIGGLKGTFSMDKAVSGSLMNYCTTGSLAYWQLAFPGASGSWNFQGLLTEFTPQAMDAQKPDLMQADIVIETSGSMTLL